MLKSPKCCLPRPFCKGRSWRMVFEREKKVVDRVHVRMAYTPPTKDLQSHVRDFLATNYPMITNSILSPYRGHKEEWRSKAWFASTERTKSRPLFNLQTKMHTFLGTNLSHLVSTLWPGCRRDCLSINSLSPLTEKIISSFKSQIHLSCSILSKLKFWTRPSNSST